MSSVGVIPLKPLLDPNHLRPRVCDWPALMALSGHLTALEAASLGAEVRQLSDEEMVRVEDGLSELLALQFICQPIPVLPAAPPGAVTYPRWGEIYYAGPPIAGERKRYVVVSNDYWNATGLSVVAVRTTSQPKRAGRSFPEIEGGAARACCGDATSFPCGDFDLDDRPIPPRLDLDDMARVGWGMAETHALYEAIARLGIEVP
jgi:hypothetical protein